MLNKRKTGAANNLRNWIMACFATASLLTGVDLLFPAPADAAPGTSIASQMPGNTQSA